MKSCVALIAATLLIATSAWGNTITIGSTPTIDGNTISFDVVAFDDDGNRLPGGTFNVANPSFSESSNPDGTVTISGTLSDFTAKDGLNSDGRFVINIEYEADGEVFKCPLKIDPKGLTITVKKQKSTAGDTSSAANAEEPNGGNNDVTADAGDPVSTATREFFFYQNLIDLRGPTLPLTFDLFHGSQLTDNAFFTHLPEDFAHNHHLSARVIDFDGSGTFFNLEFDLGLGRVVAFERTPPATDWTLVEGERWNFSVEETATHFHLCDPERQRLFIFKKHPLSTQIEPAFITHIIDRNGNILTYTQPADPTLTGPTAVTDNLGRNLTFTYGQPDELTSDFRFFITEVTDHTGRKILFNYTQVNGVPRLASIADTIGGLYRFAYDANGFMTGKTYPAGNTPYTQTYDAIPDFFGVGVIGAVATQTDAFGDTFTFADGRAAPGLGEKHVVVTNPDGSQFKHFHSDSNIATAIVDEFGEKQLFTADDTRDRITAAIDRDGGDITYTYRDASGHIASITNQIGDTTTYTYSETTDTFTNPENADTITCTFAELDRIGYADGTSTQFIRDANGNATSITNRAAETTSFTFNGRGQPLTRTNPTAGATTFTYDSATALPASVTDSDTGITTFAYDNLSRLEKITRPDSSELNLSYDALDRLISRTDEENVVTQFQYDANSNLTQITKAGGTAVAQGTSFTYDALDRLKTITDPEGDTTTLAYDYHEAPTSITFPDASQLTFIYDKRRSLTEARDEEGQATTFSRTASDLLSSVTSALGRTTTIARDLRGLPIKITDPTGDLSQLQLDVFGRLIHATDPLQRVTTRTFDGVGRKLTQNDPRHGTTTYTRDAAGRLTKLTDPNGNEWESAYTSMGRLSSFEDPDNRAQTRTYDNRGRLETITAPDGIVETRVHNPDSTLQSRTFSSGLAHTFTYDSLNRLIGSTRTLSGKTDNCSVAYDRRNKVISTTVNGQTTNATYDNRSRLKTITYPGGITVTYTYDKRGLVTRIEDSLTNAFIDFAYNADREVMSATRSNGRVTTYSYDREGLLENLSHDTGATIEWTYNRADEPLTIADAGFPAEALPNFVTGTQTVSYNASSQITTAGHTGDPRGRRTADPDRSNHTWDADDRLIAITKSATTITYCYDALDRLTSRTEGATTTDYLYNFALRTHPIIGELENGTFNRIYITHPDGRLAYFIDDPAGTPQVHFYHFGKTGNTRFLTDAAGTVTDAYAYDAFGQSAGRTGTSDQIYTYVGAFGVRDDEAACLYHMRHRYYDPVTRRFLSRDPIFRSLYARNGGETNPYHYARNMPTSAVDPGGLQVVDTKGVSLSTPGGGGFQIGVGGQLIGINSSTSQHRSSQFTRVLGSPLEVDKSEAVSEPLVPEQGAERSDDNPLAFLEERFYHNHENNIEDNTIGYYYDSLGHRYEDSDETGEREFANLIVVLFVISTGDMTSFESKMEMLAERFNSGFDNGQISFESLALSQLRFNNSNER